MGDRCTGEWRERSPFAIIGTVSIWFSSPRSFRLWSYRVGQGLLLLRSVKSAEDTTRIDVLLKSVTAMKLPQSFGTLLVRDPSAEEDAQIRASLGTLANAKQQVFVVEGGPFTGWVLASAVVHAEDEGSWLDPSSLGSHIEPP